MKKRLLLTALAVAAAMQAMPADRYIKREVRGVWMATVSCIDWPNTTGLTYTVRKAQQAEMTKYLDKLQAANINAVYFQTRPMADALYKSSYEPVSSYFTGVRGSRLPWDPLQFMVEECHKRGMECHAWVNPYRWKRKSDPEWSTAQDNKLKSDGMLVSYNGNVILNPALPATRERIVNVCREMIEGYDIDGIIFDDYFYPSGMPTTSDAEDYNDWQDSGTDLSFGDWRRANVNQMVADVYNMIQEVDPAIKFGISPAGAACSDATVAAKHGVDPIPKGSDWQYNSIFSDPVAWLEEGTIDYISPQLYWKTDHSTNPFGPMTQWWSKIAKKFGRHHYASHSLTYMQTSNTTSDWTEAGRQIQYSRQYTKNAAPGAIFYSACDLDGKKAEGFDTWLLKNKFRHPALTPAIDWKEHEEYGCVTGLASDGYSLTWDDMGHVRYSVYAVPDSLPISSLRESVTGGLASDYLLGTFYTDSLRIPDDYAEGYRFAVCVLDRYGNEFEPAYTETSDVITDIAGAPFDIIMDGWTLTTGTEADAIQVYNTTGMLVRAEEHTAELDLTGLPTGIYIVKAVAGKRNAIKKIYVR